MPTPAMSPARIASATAPRPWSQSAAPAFAPGQHPHEIAVANRQREVRDAARAALAEPMPDGVRRVVEGWR